MVHSNANASVVVVGTGAAGLSAALELARNGFAVKLLTKTKYKQSGSSPYAQGGLAASLDTNDTAELHAEDTIRAAAGLGDPDFALKLAKLAPLAIEDLIKMGFKADRGIEGELDLGLEAGHQKKRIIHAGGDRSGKILIDALWKKIESEDKIEVLTDYFAIDYFYDYNKGSILSVFTPEGVFKIYSQAVILATGGIGQIYKTTTNPVESTGDGLALAARAGAMLKDIEFIQFHPTGLVDNQNYAIPHRSILLTEALRGAGAHLVNEHGQRFMKKVHETAELAPRDIVSSAMAKILQAGGKCYLDVRPVIESLGVSEFKSTFPTAIQSAKDAGLDIYNEALPVEPSAHFHMGGVAIDQVGQTTIEGLYAIGEVACTGVHGANRLASNSLTEALIMGKIVAQHISSQPLKPHTTYIKEFVSTSEHHNKDVSQGWKILHEITTQAMSLCRDEKGLLNAMENLCDLTLDFQFPDNRSTYELNNAITVSELILYAALQRQESRGAHVRQDFPDIDLTKANSFEFSYDEVQMKIYTKLLQSA